MTYNSGYFQMAFFKQMWDTVKNAAVARCTLENDTMYRVLIIDHDGTRCLNPGEVEGNYLVRGFGIDLIIKFNDKEEVKISFPSSQFQNRRHKLSVLFQKQIREYQIRNKNIQVKEITTVWRFIHCHPGGFEQEVETEIVRKHSWSNTKEDETELALSINCALEGIELSPSFKKCTKLTRVDQYEQQLTQVRKQKFDKDPSYLWQEIIVVDTNQRAPLHILEIPTPHIERTSTAKEPSRDLLLYGNSQLGDS